MSLARAFVAAAVVLVISSAPAAPQSGYEDAARLFQQGRAAEAEAILKPLIEKHPGDARVLALMGAVLDSQQRFEQAEPYYQRALALAPRSPALLNNAGNHYLAAGRPGDAAVYFRKVVALDPGHPNANLHLAQMSIANQRGTEALAYLDHLPAAEQGQPMVHLLRGHALALAKQCAKSQALLAPLEERDPSFSFTIGLAYAACKRYAEAEGPFTHALQADPRNFDVLYNLGLAAARAGHLDRARQVLEIALKQKPDEPDALYAFAEVLARSGNKLSAAALLYRLHKLQPRRAEVLLLLANTANELGYYEEAAGAYRKYLALKPADGIARRELAFALVRSGQSQEGIPELRSYVLRNPKDAQGQYELAVAEALTDARKALARLDRTLAVDPALTQARYARAVLHVQEEQPAESLADFEYLSERDPRNPQLLDWLGRVYLATGQAAKAAEVLKRALELAPRDPPILMHYSSALRELGRKDELADVLAALKQAAANTDLRRPHRGLFQFLSLSPAEQRTRYLESIESAAAANPGDASLKARWANALLQDGRTDDAVRVYRELLALSPDAAIRAECGGQLLEFEQYGLAAEFLEPVPGSHLDLAIAIFHSSGAQAGLSALEKIPEPERRGDFYVVRAQMLDALGKSDEAAESLNRGIRAAPTRADVYFQAALFLMKHRRQPEAAQLLADAIGRLPDASDLMLARAIVLELIGKTDEAMKLLEQIERRWPEWGRPYLMHGIILDTALRHAEALQMLDTAIALGAREPSSYFYRALAATHAAPDKPGEARDAALQAVALVPDDPEARLLAGKILLSLQEYPKAIEHLTQAVRLDPGLVRARYLLVTLYRELGEREKSEEQAKEVDRLSRERPAEPPPDPMERLLFGVRPPGARSGG